MKQETIEQLMKIAGKHEYSKTLILDVSQVQAMLEASYEAGQRDPNTVGGVCQTDWIRYELNEGEDK